MKRLLLYTCLMAALVVHAAETRYNGKLIDVVDSLNADHPELVVGIDPLILHDLVRRDLSFTAKDDWVADLKTALSAQSLTTISMKQYKHLLITTPSALMRYQGLLNVDSGQLIIAGKYFNAALKTEPDNVQVQALARFATDLGSLYAQALKDESALSGSLKERESAEVIGDKLAAYDKAWENLFTTFWKDFRLCAARGVDSDLYPLYTFAWRQSDRYVDLLNQCQKRYPAFVDANSLTAAKELQRHLADAGMLLKGEKEKGDLLISKGETFFHDGNTDLALNVFRDAFDLVPTDLKARTYLGWLQAGVRQVRIKDRQRFIEDHRVRPSVDDQTKGLRGYADAVIKRADRHQANILLALLDSGKLPIKLDDTTYGSLKLLAETRQAPQMPGQIDGLVTQGGEFTGGELFPISVTLGPRKDLSHYHELRINDIAHDFDRDMQISFGQAFSWLDYRAKGILRNYAITLHFKDLESAKGGDSLGAAVATSAFSALYQLPVRAAVTMTGSMRSYGGIAAIGGLPAKIEAAIAGHKQIMIVPEDNLTDLSLLPPEQTRKVRIMLAKTIDDYLVSALQGAAPAKDEAAATRADDLFRVAGVFEAMGLMHEAMGVYQHVLILAPNDYSSQQAVSLYEQGKFIPSWPDWLEKLEFSPPAPTDDTPLLSTGELLDQPTNQIVLHATACLAQASNLTLGTNLLAAALALQPRNHDALLLRARTMLKQPIPSPTANSGILIKVDAAALLSKAAMQCLASPDPRLRTTGNLYWALIIQYFDPQNEAALVAFALAAEKGTKLDVAALTSDLIKLNADARPITAAPQVAAFHLTPLSVPIVDPSTLPAEGKAWTAYGTGGAGDEEDAGDLALPAPADTSPATPATPANPANPAAKSVAIKFESAVENIKVASGGAILVVKLANEASLRLLSVAAHRQIGIIKLPSADILYACGRSRIVVYNKVDNQMIVYTTDGHQVTRHPLGVSGVPVTMDMGCNTDDNILMRIAKGTSALDSTSYYLFSLSRKSVTQTKTKDRNGCYRDNEHLRLSPDGTHYGAWCTSHSPSGVIAGFIQTSPVDVKYTYDHDSKGHVVPLGDTGFFVCGGGVILNQSGNVIKNIGQPLFADVNGRIVLAMMENGRVDVYNTTNFTMLGSTSLGDFKLDSQKVRYSWTQNDLTPDRWVIPISRYRVATVLVDNGSTLVFVPLPIN